ncbi:hypothetical protein QBC40DRAFT_223795 [Triangularia verruculosa]|uniref:Uncharacterized protein n=1 Tax=Triangularia verruculosa TaxID=2587418 RepID=A0AAN6XJ73_9PEZI|nr:hypothetical protein QBC40DRAFT_223795 [Triangularia verruculosa]
MAVTIQHLNSDASFLFTFEPIAYQHSQLAGPSRSPKPFRILIDPWITGPATSIHTRIARATHRRPPCILTLLELPEPDLIIISHHSSRHCNEATLRQLPGIGTKTNILAALASARKIKSWNFLEKTKVRILPVWRPSKRSDPKGPHILRFTVPSIPPGEPGEVTMAFLPQKHDLLGLHYAIGITYRAPSPPLHHLPLSPQFRNESQISLRSTTRQQEQQPLPFPNDRPISILYVPHGISYSAINAYVTNHLISEAALPLTALLHPFNVQHRAPFSRSRDPVPSGLEIATKLAAKTWIGAHDGDLVHRGLASRFFTRKQEKANIFTESDLRKHLAMHEKGSNTTTVLLLESGEKTTLRSTTASKVDNRAEVWESNEEQGQEQQKSNTEHTAGDKTESHDPKRPSKEEEQAENVALIKVGSSDSGKGQNQADVLMGSLEKCNWRSNLELFLQKDNSHGGSLAKQKSL